MNEDGRWEIWLADNDQQVDFDVVYFDDNADGYYDRWMPMPRAAAGRAMSLAEVLGQGSFGGTIRPVEREDQVRCQPLPVRMLRHQLLELTDQLSVPAQREIRRHPVLEHREAKLLQPRHGRLRERLVRESASGSPRQSASPSRSVSAAAAGSPPGGRLRLALPPQALHERVRRDDVVRPQQQQRQQRSLATAAHRHDIPFESHLERAEDEEHQPPTSFAAIASPAKRGKSCETSVPR